MRRLEPHSLRGKVTSITLLATLCAMVAVVVITFTAMRLILKASIADALSDQVDEAVVLVGEGRYQDAVSIAGIGLLQVMDGQGRVLASSPALQGHVVTDVPHDGDVQEMDTVDLRRDAGDDGSSHDEEDGDAYDGGADDDDGGDVDDGGGVDDADGGAGGDDVDDDDDAHDDDGGEDDAAAVDSHLRLAAVMLVGRPEVAYAAGDIDVPSSMGGSVVLGGDGPYLVMRRDVQSGDGTVTVTAVASMASAVHAAKVASGVLAVLFALLLALSAVFSWRMTGRVLEPVQQMRRKAAEISTSNLSERIPIPRRDRDLAELANTFNELIARMEAAFDEQKRFISDAGHELKSPIAAVGVMLELLRNHPEAVDEAQVLEDIAGENNRMRAIVSDLLTLSRHDEGRMSMDRRPVDIMDVVLEAVDTLHAYSSVPVDTQGVQPVVCSGDAALLSHALRNLLDNAARHARYRIRVSCGREDDHVYIMVSDDGPGIPEADWERVFGRFVQLDEGRDRSSGGTGLGLPVVKGIVEAHGGSVRFVDSEIGGATVRVELP